MGDTSAEGDFIGCSNIPLEVFHLPEQEGITITDACRRCGVSCKTYYEWRNSFKQRGINRLKDRSHITTLMYRKLFKEEKSIFFVGKSIEKFKMYLKRRFAKTKPLLKPLSPPLIMCLFSIVMMLRLRGPPFLGLFSVLVFLVSILILLFILELSILFSRSIFDGTPKKPSSSGILLELLLFFGLISFIFGDAIKLTFTGKTIVLVFIAFIILWVHRSVKSYDIKCNTAGKIFTYTSISTIWYLVIVAAVFLILLDFDPTMFPVIIRQALEPPINWKIALAIIFLFVLTIIFFIIKESVFQHYSRKLASLESESLKKEKEKRINLICEKLDDAVSGDGTRMDMLSSEVELLEKRVAYIGQEINKIEKKFEFHESLKLNIAASPVGFLILEVVKDVPVLAEIFKSVFGPLFGL